MTPIEMIQEWRKGCSNAKRHPSECQECTVALISSLEAALSHAEGEAVGKITIDKHGDAYFKASPGWLDLDQGTHQLYTNPAPQVAVPEGYALVPEDMLTHFRDFHDAVKTLSKTADPDGYWEHQCEVCKRIESQLAAAPTNKHEESQ